MTDTANALRLAFENSYARALPELVVEHAPERVPHPELVVVNDHLAERLGIPSEDLDTADGAAVLSGDALAESSKPVAMVYSGHQFGGFSPILGDGRAVLLGELVDPDGVRFDLHLKGSGRTPFSRGGDGKATIGPMLREFLIAEAMAAVCIPTTRALAVATTGEQVRRNQLEPGAVLTRVASSHLRVGTFQFAAQLEDPEVLRRLADYAIDRHHPAAASGENPYLELLRSVLDVQAELVARWMLVGFVHGVLNTDNVTISGEGIDYGPCAFLDRYDPATFFSSIDRGGRYAFENQPKATWWNLTRFAETLLPLIDDDLDAAVQIATSELDTLNDRFTEKWNAGMAAKLGVDPSVLSADPTLFEDFLALLEAGRVDYTNSFRALSSSLRGDRQPGDDLFQGSEAFTAWEERWTSHLVPRDVEEVAEMMDATNPMFIPRNHLVEDALNAATAGDMAPFSELLEVVTNPFDDTAGPDRFREPAPVEFEDTFQTFCGT